MNTAKHSTQQAVLEATQNSARRPQPRSLTTIRRGRSDH
jgi:hypothetical protein